MVIVVIESPYAGEVSKNKKYARAALADSLNRGEAPFASHLLYTQVLDDNLPPDRAQGISAGLAYHNICDKVVFYLDHGMSSGMVAAWQNAINLGIRIEARYLY